MRLKCVATLKGVLTFTGVATLTGFGILGAISHLAFWTRPERRYWQALPSSTGRIQGPVVHQLVICLDKCIRLAGDMRKPVCDISPCCCRGRYHPR